jgi:hypothetical protein
MIEIEMGWSSLYMPIERIALLIIQSWQETRHVYTDPDVRIVVHIGDHDVIYDGTATRASLIAEIERVAEKLDIVEEARGYAQLFQFITTVHEVVKQIGCDFTFEYHGHPVTVRPEDDPATLCQEYLSQWEE